VTNLASDPQIRGHGELRELRELREQEDCLFSFPGSSLGTPVGRGSSLYYRQDGTRG